MKKKKKIEIKQYCIYFWQKINRYKSSTHLSKQLIDILVNAANPKSEGLLKISLGGNPQ